MAVVEEGAEWRPAASGQLTAGRVVASGGQARPEHGQARGRWGARYPDPAIVRQVSVLEGTALVVTDAAGVPRR
jgi:hypothetical protein